MSYTYPNIPSETLEKMLMESSGSRDSLVENMDGGAPFDQMSSTSSDNNTIIEEMINEQNGGRRGFGTTNGEATGDMYGGGGGSSDSFDLQTTTPTQNLQEELQMIGGGHDVKSNIFQLVEEKNVIYIPGMEAYIMKNMGAPTPEQIGGGARDSARDSASDSSVDQKLEHIKIIHNQLENQVSY